MTFLYFAYGSNLLRQRLQLQNPSAEFVSTGKLEGYRLTFSCLDRPPATIRWRGGAATIVEHPGQVVWGCVWRLKNEHMASLDRQEGVYEAIDVDINQDTESDVPCRCRTYILNPSHLQAPEESRRPSPMYMDVIIRGAEQNGLPEQYIRFLKSIPNNGFHEDIKLYTDIIKLLDNSNI